MAERYGYDILSLHIVPDHVHLFLVAHLKHAPSEIIRTIKSVTAREMREQHTQCWNECFGAVASENIRFTWERQEK